MASVATMTLKIRNDFSESINGLHANLLLNQFLFHNEKKEIIFFGKNELVQIIKTYLSTALTLSHYNNFFNLSIQLINQHFVMSLIPFTHDFSTDLLFSYALVLAINFEIKQFYIGPVYNINSNYSLYSDSFNGRSISLNLKYADLVKTMYSIISNAQVQECYFIECQNIDWYVDCYFLSIQQILEKIVQQISTKFCVKCDSTYFFMSLSVNKDNKELMLEISNAIFPWKQECIFSGPDIVFDNWRYLDLLASICKELDIVEIYL